MDRSALGSHREPANASYLYAALAAQRDAPTRNYADGNPGHSTVTHDLEQPDVWPQVRHELFDDDASVTLEQIVEWAGQGGY